jgi:histidine triad (HIT) family protein
MSSDCLFCKIASGEIPSEIVHQDEKVVAFRDVNPQAPTHILIVPREHIATTNDLQESHDGLMGHILRTAKDLAAGEKIGERGYRVVLNCLAEAGQSVFHLHFHLLGGRPMKWPPG